MLNKLSFLADKEEWLRQIVENVNQMIDGRSNAIGEFTLTASATSTDVSDLRVGTDSRILLMPTTANAAAAISTSYISSVGKQTFTIAHANNSQTDRTFKYAIVG